MDGVSKEQRRIITQRCGEMIKERIYIHEGEKELDVYLGHTVFYAIYRGFR